MGYTIAEKILAAHAGGTAVQRISAASGLIPFLQKHPDWKVA